MALPPALAQQIPRGNDAKSVRLRQFIKKYALRSWEADRNGFVHNADGVLSTPLAGRAPVEVVYEFLETNKDLFGITNPRAELKVLAAGEVNPRTGWRHLRLQQLYAGLEVAGAQLLAHYNRDGILQLIDAGCYLGINLPTTPVISREAALEIVAKDIGPADSINVHGCRLLIYPRDTVCYLAWNIFARPRPRQPSEILDSTGMAIILIPDDDTRGGEYSVDALTGRIIFQWSGVYDRLPTPPDTSGLRGPKGPRAPVSWPPRLPVDRPKPSGTAIPAPDSGWIRLNERESESEKPLKGDTVDSAKGGRPDRLIRWGPMQLQALPEAESTREGEEPQSPPQSSERGSANPDGIITIMTQNFEGSFPSSGWTLYGNPTWDDDNCRSHAGSWSAWCARAGSQGVDPCGPNDYRNNMNAQMKYGPFSLSDAKAAELTFWYWLASESCCDFLYVGASGDGASFLGYAESGYSGGWMQYKLPLCQYVGDGSVWVIIAFQSDGSITDQGAYVDDIVLTKRTDGQPDLGPVVPPGWDYPVVVSRSTGTNVFENPMAGETAHIDLAWGNAGVGCAGIHAARLYLNGVQIWAQDSVVCPPQAYFFFEDIPYVFSAPGVDTLRLEADADHQVAESNESNNSFSIAFGVRCAGDYAIGSGCSVVPGISHPTINTWCDTWTFTLKDRTRLPFFNYIATYQWIDSLSNPYLYWDWDNQWNDPSAGQCQGVDAHAYTAWAYDYMATVLGRPGFDSLGSNMVNIVDRTGYLNNAEFDTSLHRVTFYVASPGYRSFAGCPDVVAHEWGHGITHFASNLNYEKESGALSESFSDMFGTSVEMAYAASPNWLIGENSGMTLRDMEHPTWYGQPDTYLDTVHYWIHCDAAHCPVPDRNNDFCGVHTNSGVPNKMFYLLAHGGYFRHVTVTAIGVSQAMYVMYYANANFWRPIDSFFSACTKSISAANANDPSGGWGLQVCNAWHAVGVFCRCHADPGCNGVADVNDVLMAVGVAFRGYPQVFDPICPYARTDVDCNEVTTVNDVVRFVNVAFRAGTRAVNFCNPCAP